MTKNWEAIKDVLLERVSEEYLEFMSNREILLLFISGESAESISKNLNIDEKEVTSILLQYFPECGRMYVENKNPAYLYRRKISMDSVLGKELGKLYYTACEIFYSLDSKY